MFPRNSKVLCFALLDDRLYESVGIVSIVHLSLHKLWSNKFQTLR